jgi:hypothetical protein
LGVYSPERGAYIPIRCRRERGFQASRRRQCLKGRFSTA